MHRGEPKIVLNRDNRDLTPSIVSRGKRGELLVGVPAKSRALIDPQNTISSIKRFMGRKYADPDVHKALARVSYRVTEGQDGDVRVWLGDREYTPIEISALILRRLKEDAENREHEKFTRAVITVPAYFGERQVAATREAGRMAGFHVLKIINEPTAAALAYGLNLEQGDDGKIILIYDLGGGTFDISILLMMQGAITVLGIEGDNLLGGDDFDHDITERLLEEAKRQHNLDLSSDRIALQKIRSEAESTKITLSSQEAADIILPALGHEQIDLEIELSRIEFEQMIRPRMERTIDLTHKAIRGSSLTPDNIDNILLVGGSTSIPLSEALLRTVFGDLKIRKNVNPMQCVAVGAAIQTALITDIECPNCQTRNSIQQDTCTQCSVTLYGADKVSCPVCYMPCNPGDPTCWKCGTTLAGTTTPLTISPSQPETQVDQRCPNCGKPFKPGAATCSICNYVLIEQGGLKCSKCGYLNIQGAIACAKCGIEIAGPRDITSKPLGIELNDGKMSVIIEKGTGFPTEDLIRKEFKTAVAGQRRLEVAVYEGFDEIAQKNQLCGIVSMPLPPNLPRGAPISIGFGLNGDRMITVVVKLRSGGGEDKHVTFDQFVDPDRLRKIEEHREKLTRFMDRWQNELKEAERQDLQGIVNELESAGVSNQVKQIEPLIARGDAILEQIIEIRGTDANISNFLFACSKYLSEQQRTMIASWIADLDQARERADWTGAFAISGQIDQDMNQFSDTLHVIARCRICALQDKLSPALSHRVTAALSHLDDGVDKNDKEVVDRGIAELFGLWDNVKSEIRNLGEVIPGGHDFKPGRL